MKGKTRDHGLVVAKFRWRLGKRKRNQYVNWRALKPVVTLVDDAVNVNATLDSFEMGCQAQWESTGKYIARGDPMVALNWVTTCVAKQVLPQRERMGAARMKPSATSLAFAKERAAEIARGVSPQREKQLHRKMYRHRRRDHRMWYRQSIGKLRDAVRECRWGAVKACGNLIRGVRKKAVILSSLRYRGNGLVRTDKEVADQWKLYMQDLGSVC